MTLKHLEIVFFCLHIYNHGDNPPFLPYYSFSFEPPPPFIIHLFALERGEWSLWCIMLSFSRVGDLTHIMPDIWGLKGESFPMHIITLPPLCPANTLSVFLQNSEYWFLRHYNFFYTVFVKISWKNWNLDYFILHEITSTCTFSHLESWFKYHISMLRIHLSL